MRGKYTSYSNEVRTFKELYKGLFLDEEYPRFLRIRLKWAVASILEFLFFLWAIIQLIRYEGITTGIQSILNVVAIYGSIASILLFPLCLAGYSAAEGRRLDYLWSRQQAFFQQLQEFGVSYEIRGTPTHPDFVQIGAGSDPKSIMSNKEVPHDLEEYQNASIAYTPTFSPHHMVMNYLTLIALAKNLTRYARRKCHIYALGILIGAGILISYWYLIFVDGSLAVLISTPTNFDGFLFDLFATIVFLALYIYESKWLLYVQIPLGYDLQRKIRKMNFSG